MWRSEFVISGHLRGALRQKVPGSKEVKKKTEQRLIIRAFLFKFNKFLLSAQ